jgi:hypothetical protein
MKNKKENPNPCRSKWDMQHKSKKDYNRKKEKGVNSEPLANDTGFDKKCLLCLGGLTPSGVPNKSNMPAWFCKKCNAYFVDSDLIDLGGEEDKEFNWSKLNDPFYVSKFLNKK